MEDMGQTMAKSEKQKLKLLYIMQCLTEKTDAEHSVTTQEIIDYLALQGINAERKSIYTDIDLLIDYGMDIVKNSGRSGGYTLVSRQFFGWITGLGNIVKIEAPERVVEQYRDYLGEIIERYS